MGIVSGLLVGLEVLAQSDMKRKRNSTPWLPRLGQVTRQTLDIEYRMGKRMVVGIQLGWSDFK